MRIDLANLIAAQSSRTAPAKTPPPAATFANELKPAAPKEFEALILPQAKSTAPAEAQANLEPARKNPFERPRLGSQIDIKI